MKNLRKAMATLAALSVMCVSASAFAAVTEVKTGGDAVSFDYDAVESGNTVEATVDTSKAQTGKQMTFIILGNDADEANVTADDILYIDQKELKADSNTFTGVINTARIDGAPDSIPDGDYIIKLGYYDTSDEFQITKAVMTVASGPSGRTVKFVFGDVNGGEYTGSATTDMSAITAGDALDILKVLDGLVDSTGGAFPIGTVVTDKDGVKSVFGDVNGGEYTGSATTDMSAITAGDALDILKVLDGLVDSTGGAYPIGTVVSAIVAE